MVERTFNLMSNANTLIDKSSCDILIETSGLEKISIFDLHSQNQIMERGYQTAANTMTEKRSLEIVRRCHRHALLEKKVKARLQMIGSGMTNK
jgi:NTE family protein